MQAVTGGHLLRPFAGRLAYFVLRHAFFFAKFRLRWVVSDAVRGNRPESGLNRGMPVLSLIPPLIKTSPT